MGLLNNDAFLSLLFILILSGVFIVHEAGHLLMARLFGVYVSEISMGFGREFWGTYDRHGTRWVLRVFPFCGMVKLDSDAPPERGENAYFARRSFASRPLGQRFLIVLAGPAMNFFFVLAAFTIFYALVGRPSTLPLVTGVMVDSPADHAGLEVGDQIVFFNGRRVTRFEDVTDQLTRPYMRDIPVVVLRGGQEGLFHIAPEWVRYTDINGFERAHGRTGILAMQTPFRLDVLSVRGEDGTVLRDLASIRAVILDMLDRGGEVGIPTTDGQVHFFKIRPPSSANRALIAGEADAPLYLGDFEGSVYINRDFSRAALDGIASTARLTRGVLATTGDLLIVDYERITPELLVSGGDLGFMKPVHGILFIACLLSVCIGLINLLPLPGLDGYLLLRYGLEILWGKRGAAYIHPYLWRTVMLFVFLWLFMANVDDLRILHVPSIPSLSEMIPLKLPVRLSN